MEAMKVWHDSLRVTVIMGGKACHVYDEFNLMLACQNTEVSDAF